MKERSTESCAVKPHKRRKKKKDQKRQQPKEVKSPPRMMEFESDKENFETQRNHSISMESDAEVIRLCADSEKRCSDVPDSKSGERHKSKKKLLEASKTGSSKKRKFSDTEDPVVQENLEDDCSSLGNVPLRRKKSSKKKERLKKEKKKPKKKRKHKSINENSEGENPKQQAISPRELPEIIEFMKDDEIKLENDCLMLDSVPLRRKKSSKKEVKQPMKAKVPGKKRKVTINDNPVKEYPEHQDMLPSELPEILESDDEKDPNRPLILNSRKRDSKKPTSKLGKKHKLKEKLLEVRETKSSKRRKFSETEDKEVQEKLENDCSSLGNVPLKRKISSEKGLEETNVPCKKRKTSKKENSAEKYPPDQDLLFRELPEVIELVEDEEKDFDPNSPDQGSHKKRKHSNSSDTQTHVVKSHCKDDNKVSDTPNCVLSMPQPKSWIRSFQRKQYNLQDFFRLMYQLDLSVLCSLRRSVNEQTYPSLSLSFGDPEIFKFSDIVIRYHGRSVHVAVEGGDSYFPSTIGFSKLFTKVKQTSSLDRYFDSFVKHIICTPDALHSVEYLVIYTNAVLDLTEEKELKQGRFKDFYPFRFKTNNLDEHDFIKTLLSTRDTRLRFYQFSPDENMREEVSKRLNFTSDVQKIVEESYPQGFVKEIKEAFLDKLVFAAKQPNREELNCVVRSETTETGRESYCLKSRKNILGKLVKQDVNILKVVYEFNLCVLFLHNMFLNKKILSIKTDSESSGVSFGITVDYKGKNSYIRAYHIDSNIGFVQLFSSKSKNAISIQKLFSIFVEKIEEDLRYFIIYTNGTLDLTEEMELKKNRCKEFYPLKFDVVDIDKKKYKILRNCSCIEGSTFYQFSKEEKTREKLLSLLKISPDLEDSNLPNNEIKDKFLDKLIFVTEQPCWKKLQSLVKEEIDDQPDVPYNCIELFEIAVRWFESYETDPIRKEVVEELLGDVKNNFLNYQEVQNSASVELLHFAKRIGRGEGTEFYRFLHFLIKREGRWCLDVLKKEGIKLSYVSSILWHTGNRAINAFKDFYGCLFDEEGNKTVYLKTLEKEGVGFSVLSRILFSTRVNAAVAFIDLYDLWFSSDGKKTKYLKKLQKNGVDLSSMCRILKGAGTGASKAFKDLYDLFMERKETGKRCFEILEQEGINISVLSSIISGARSNAPKAFKDLYDVWFDEKGNRRKCLETIKKEGISLSNVSTMLSGSRMYAAEAFQELYSLWFEENGNKKQCFQNLKNEGISLPSIASILGKSGYHTAKAFNNIYHLLFDEQGNVTHYLKVLKKENIKFSSFSTIIKGATIKAPMAFKGLYDAWFDNEGNKKQCLKFLIEKGVNLSNVTSILSGAGCHAPDAFKDLYDLWFDDHGNKKHWLKTIEQEGIRLSIITSILNNSGFKAAEAFKCLYNAWFDEQGNRKECLVILKENGISLSNMSSILLGSGAKASKAFKDLYNLWFNKKGKKTQYLKSLEREGINLSSVSSILHTAGANSSKAF